MPKYGIKDLQTIPPRAENTNGFVYANLGRTDFPQLEFSTKLELIDKDVTMQKARHTSNRECPPLIRRKLRQFNFEPEIESFLVQQAKRNSISTSTFAYIPRRLILGPLEFKWAHRPNLFQQHRFRSEFLENPLAIS
jgi:hypothetical protein